jgi:hypothetical protein
MKSLMAALILVGGLVTACNGSCTGPICTNGNNTPANCSVGGC